MPSRVTWPVERRLHVPLPYWDEWSTVTDFRGLADGHDGRADLVAHHNEHRILIFAAGGVCRSTALPPVPGGGSLPLAPALTRPLPDLGFVAARLGHPFGADLRETQALGTLGLLLAAEAACRVGSGSTPQGGSGTALQAARRSDGRPERR